MRNGIKFQVSAADRERLERVIKDRNAAQKDMWRASIILLSADGVGTAAIMRQTGKSKTCVWRWQERFMVDGVEGLLRDKTRPSRIAPLGPDVAERMIRSIRAAPILLGARGRPPADIPALAAMLARLSVFAMQAGPRLRAIDLNPVFAMPAGEGAYAADAVIELGDA